MQLNVTYLIVGILGAIVAMLATFGLGLRWVYKQGAASARLVTAVNANTDATGKLTTAYERFTEKTADTLLDHEKRITRVEIAQQGALTP